MNRTLNPEQERESQRAIIDMTRGQSKLSSALWTRQAVAELIRIRFGIAMPVRTIGHYLLHWAFIPQKPPKHAN